jgi:hypothetical protein
MQSHRIVFRFEGGQADDHRLDASDHLAYDTGARQLLATHAYFMLTHRVPNGGAQSRGAGYHVYALDPREACFEGHWLVELLLEEATKLGLGYAAKKAWRYTYNHLLKDSIGAILSGRQSSMPPELRSEPVLPGLDKINEPVFDVEAERDYRWRQLRERTTLALSNACRPVGRSARKLTIMADDILVAIVDEDRMRRLMADAQAYRSAQITSALKELGLRPAPRGPGSSRRPRAIRSLMPRNERGSARPLRGNLRRRTAAE